MFEASNHFDFFFLFVVFLFVVLYEINNSSNNGSGKDSGSCSSGSSSSGGDGPRKKSLFRRIFIYVLLGLGVFSTLFIFYYYFFVYQSSSVNSEAAVYHFVESDRFFFDWEFKFVPYNKVVAAYPSSGEYAPFFLYWEPILERSVTPSQYDFFMSTFIIGKIRSCGLVFDQETFTYFLELIRNIHV